MLDLVLDVDFQPRPLDTIGSPQSQEEQIRDIIGPASYDAMMLAVSLDIPLFADDLGLRRLAAGYGATESVSTISLLYVLAERGLITLEERNVKLTKISGRGHVFVPASTSLLQSALATAHNLGSARVAQIFGLLGSPLVGLDEAATILAEVVRRSATSTIQLQLQSVGEIVRLGLAGMVQRWPLASCASAVYAACRESLLLLPDPLGEVRKTIDAFTAQAAAKK